MVEPRPRRTAGAAKWTEVFGVAPREPRGPLAEAALDFVCAEVWTRAELARRDRRLLTITCLTVDRLHGPLGTMVDSCLRSVDVSLDDLREIALHLATVIGFPAVADGLHRIVVEAAGRLAALPVRAEDGGGAPDSKHHAERPTAGRGGDFSPLSIAFLDLVSNEVRARPGLTGRDRALTSIAAAAGTASFAEVRRQCRSAFRRQDLTVAEVEEVSLHLAPYLGFPRASLVQVAARELGVGTAGS